MTEIAAWIAVSIFIVMIVFQSLLALGAPFGKIAWGGNHRILPLNLRIGSIISVGLFIIATATLLEKANLQITFNRPGLVNILVWFYVGLFSLSTFANIVSKSRLEQKIMIPVAATLTILCLIVAIDI